MSQIQSFKKNVIRFFSKKMTGHILLYHSCYPEIPADLDYQLHNVPPCVMYEQLSWYKKNFDVVTLKDWFASKNRRGLAAITFDDAYKSVFQHGVQVLEELNVPATIFVIGKTIEGKIFWRDKIRFLVARGEISSFIHKLENKFGELENLDPIQFYDLSKSENFTSKISNKMLEDTLDNYLFESGLKNDLKNFCAENKKELINHPLLTYGNHSYSHYMLDTLDLDFLREDFSKSHEILKTVRSDKLVDILAVPFGGKKLVTSDVLQVCKELNIEGILLSTNEVNDGNKHDEKKDIKLATRFLMPATMSEFISKMDRMSYDIFKNYYSLKS